MTEPGVCFLIHGESKVGKTWLGASGPRPVLIIDAEGGTRFLPYKTVTWDGMTAPPEEGDWEVCIVPVRSYATMQSVYQWLNAGKHPFRTVVIDSLSEVQQRCVDGLAGQQQMSQQMWGDLLRQMSALVRAFRDLVTHPTSPLAAVVLITMSREVNGKRVPYVQGQLAVTLPYYIDIVGYFFTHTDESGALVRRLWVAPHALFDAGDRTGALGEVVDNPTMMTMLEIIHKRG
jgi:hypothetical protein